MNDDWLLGLAWLTFVLVLAAVVLGILLGLDWLVDWWFARRRPVAPHDDPDATITETEAGPGYTLSLTTCPGCGKALDRNVTPSGDNGAVTSGGGAE